MSRSNQTSTSVASPILQKWSTWIIAIAALVGFVLSVNNDYGLDDDYYTENLYVREGLSGIPDLFTHHTILRENEKQAYRPITALTFAIEKTIVGGFKPMVSHTINLMIYVIISLLVFILFKRLMPDIDLVIPLLGALLFAVHPIHTEVVVSIKNRDEMLACMFGLLTTLQVLSWVRGASWRHLVFAVLMFLLATLSKPSALTFLWLIPLSTLVFESRRSRKLSWSMGIGAVVAAFIYAGLSSTIEASRVREYLIYENPLYGDQMTLIERLGIAGQSIWHYATHMIWPYPQSSYYGMAVFHDSPWSDWSGYAGYLVLFLGIYFIVRWWHSHRLRAVSMLWFFIAIGLFTNLPMIVPGVVADRYAFIPSMGFCLLVVLLLFNVKDVSGRWTNLSLSGWRLYLLMGAIGVSIIWSSIRTTHWADRIDLFERDVSHYPASVKLHTMIAGEQYRRLASTPESQRTTLAMKAESHFIKALKHYPNNPIEWNNLGTLRVVYLNNPNEALKAFNQAVEFEPTYASPYYGMGVCYEMLGHPQRARQAYDRCLSLNPDHEKAATRRSKLK